VREKLTVLKRRAEQCQGQVSSIEVQKGGGKEVLPTIKVTPLVTEKKKKKKKKKKH